MCYSAGLTSSISSDVIRRPPGLLLFELEQSELRKVYAIAHFGLYLMKKKTKNQNQNLINLFLH